MKYKLNARDRLAIPRILPPKGSMLEQTTVEEIIEKVKLRSSDWPRFGLIETEDGLISNESLDPEKNPSLLVEEPFELSKAQTELLKSSVDKLDKGESVDQFVLKTCRMIKDMRGAVETIPEEGEKKK